METGVSVPAGAAEVDAGVGWAPAPGVGAPGARVAHPPRIGPASAVADSRKNARREIRTSYLPPR